MWKRGPESLPPATRVPSQGAQVSDRLALPATIDPGEYPRETILTDPKQKNIRGNAVQRTDFGIIQP